MTPIKFFGRTSLMAGLLSGTSAFADVTAQQVWDSWKSQMEMYGESGVVVGDEVMSGDTLTVGTVTLQMSDPEGSVTADMGPLTFTELGDGTVEIGMPESYVVKMVVEGDPIDLSVSNENLSTIASGTPDEISYDISADRYAIELISIGSDDVEINAAVMGLNDITGTYSIRSGNLQFLDYAVTVGSVEIDLDMREPTGDEAVVFNGQLANLIAAAKIAMPLEIDEANPESMFVDGFSVEAGYTVGATQYTFDVNADGEAVSGNASAASAGLEFAMDYDAMTYSGTGSDINLAISMPQELPFPIEAQLSEYSFSLGAPLSQEGSQGDTDFTIALRDLTLNDGLWNLFDPGSILPRDPATVALDLSGKFTPFFDFLDPAQQQAAAMADVPGELHELSLNELTVRLAGAEVLGTGAFTFDNSDMQTIPGIPRPEGEANFQINGINGLIDKLIQMGLIPQDQAMMPRMMLGMFATPVGDDQLTSKIEINEQGHILANGQRLQ